MKTWKCLILDCSIAGETPSTPYSYLYWDQDFNKIIGKRTIRQTDRQKLWIYWVMLLKDNAKQLNRFIKYLGKKNGELLNWLKLKRIREIFQNFGSFFGSQYWFNGMKIFLGTVLKMPWKITILKRNFGILEVIKSISYFKNEESSFLFLIKLQAVNSVSIISVIIHPWGWS